MTIAISGTNGITLDGQFNSASSMGFKNRIINGAMVIDQRNAGASFSPTGNGYGSCDRWASIPSSSVWTMQQVSTGNFDFPYALRVKRNAAAAASTLYYGQVIETNNCTDLAGQAVTFSFYATAGANFSGTFTVEIWTGTGTNQGWTSLGNATWTGQTLASSNTLAPTTTRTRYSYSTTLGASVAEVAVRFVYSATGTAGANDYIDITGVQLEKGSTATSFDYRPYGTELALCQRYYYRTTYGAGSATLAVGAVNGTTSAAQICCLHPVTMRAAPTAGYSGVTVYDAAVNVAVTSITAQSSSTTHATINVSATGGGLTAGRAACILAANFTQYLDFSTEL